MKNAQAAFLINDGWVIRRKKSWLQADSQRKVPSVKCLSRRLPAAVSPTLSSNPDATPSGTFLWVEAAKKQAAYPNRLGRTRFGQPNDWWGFWLERHFHMAKWSVAALGYKPQYNVRGNSNSDRKTYPHGCQYSWDFTFKYVFLGAPGWLSRLSIRLPLRSWPHGSCVQAPHQALGWQLKAWSLLQILSPSLPLPGSLSLSLSLKNKHFFKFKKKCLSHKVISLITITNSLLSQSKSQHCFSMGHDIIHLRFIWKIID